MDSEDSQEDQERQEIVQSVKPETGEDEMKHETGEVDVETGDFEDVEINLKDALEEDEVEMEERRRTAQALLGAQDHSVCTYPEGYKPRQTLFSCLTCTPAPNEAGVCYGCSLHCHSGHSIVELYTKRKFRCDCGNSKFSASGNKCTLYEEKKSENTDNHYNHNFNGLFCICKTTYPGAINEDMIQCSFCEDWYHLSHLNCDSTNAKWSSVLIGENVLICTGCTAKAPFLSKFEAAKEVVCFKNETFDDVVGPLSVVTDFRKFICSCADCERRIESAGCDFFLNSEDDIELYEKENLKKAENNQQEYADPDAGDFMNALIETSGREVAVDVMQGINKFKRELGDFFEENAKNGHVITTDDVNTFFAKIKRPRLDDPDSHL